MSSVFDEKRKLLENLDKEELINRLVMFEVMWDAIDSGTKYWMQKLYSFVRGIRRDYQPIFGVLVGLEFELKRMDIWTETKYHDYQEDKEIMERKIARISPNSLVQIDFVQERINIEELKKEEKQI